LKTIVAFIMAHQALCAAFGTWLLGNLCAAMPSPSGSSGQGYTFLFNFATLIGSSLPRSVPGLRLGTTQQTTGATLPVGGTNVPPIPTPAPKP
jgi:hypothetical protein